MFLILLILAVAIGVFFVRRNYSYWERMHFPFATPSIPFGNLGELRRKERATGWIIYDLYMSSKEKVLGVYLFFRPALLVRDAELAQLMLTTDFASFHDRGVNPDSAKDLFSLRGQAWRTLRAKLTPSFSSGKLKAMFGTIDEVGDKMIQHMNDLLTGHEVRELEMKGILTTYAIDIIGSVIFGLELDSFANPKNEFRSISTRIFNDIGFIETIYGTSTFICPPICNFMERLGYEDRNLPPFRRIVKRTIEHREKHSVTRRDILQLLIQLRNSGKINEDDKNWDVETAADELKSMSIEMIAEQAFLFYIAGSETTAATAAFTLYELSMYPELLKRAQTEVEECLEKHGLKPTDHLTYDAVQDMKFMDLCVMETIRKYPGLPFLNRLCTKDYQVPGTNYIIKKGTQILISLLALGRDPEYFPNPTLYDPDRFSEEKRNYNPIAYLPFGGGPRHCIAQRMGKVNAKTALIKLLANFNIETRPREELEFIFEATPTMVPKNGLNIRLSKKIFKEQS